MTALDTRIIEKRLAKLEEVTIRLEQEKPRSLQQLTESEVLSDATLYRLQIGIEAIVDIGSHILAEVYHQHPETYKDTLIELGTVGVVPPEFIEKNVTMVGFRNLIVHQYGEVNLEKVFSYLEKAPTIFREFAHHFALFLEKHTETTTPPPTK